MCLVVVVVRWFFFIVCACKWVCEIFAFMCVWVCVCVSVCFFSFVTHFRSCILQFLVRLNVDWILCICVWVCATHTYFWCLDNLMITQSYYIIILLCLSLLFPFIIIIILLWQTIHTCKRYFTAIHAKKQNQTYLYVYIYIMIIIILISIGRRVEKIKLFTVGFFLLVHRYFCIISHIFILNYGIYIFIYISRIYCVRCGVAGQRYF